MIGFETGWLFAHNSFPFTGGYFVPANKKSLADVYLMRRRRSRISIDSLLYLRASETINWRRRSSSILVATSLSSGVCLDRNIREVLFAFSVMSALTLLKGRLPNHFSAVSPPIENVL